MSEENKEEEEYSDFEKSLNDKVADDRSGESDEEEDITQLFDANLESDEAVEEEEVVTEGESKVEVSVDKTFDEKLSSVDSIMREVLVNSDTVDITDSDKRNYIKAVLNDVPVELELALCGGSIKTKFRSRTSWEQTCMYAALKKDQDDGIVEDLASVVIQLQKYGCCIMLQSVGDKVFSKEGISEDTSIEDAIAKLRQLRMEKVEVLSVPKWSILLNALRLFEAKLARMGTECVNEDFWEPVG